MDKLTHLLSLPFELREMIWTFCSSDQESNGLLRCCHQTRDEFSPHCRLTEDVEKLRTLQIWVDSTYEDGIWLKFDYTWGKDGYAHRAISQVRDMDDPIVQMFLKIRQVDKIVVNLHAPRMGYFVGALFMMLAKASDTYFFMSHMLRNIDPEQSDMGQVEINFSTEERQPGQTENEAKNFWECRSPKVLAEPLRKHWFHSGPMPCFYEYFLISYPCVFPHPPTINYLTWPRRHVHRKYSGDTKSARFHHITSIRGHGRPRGLSPRAGFDFIMRIKVPDLPGRFIHQQRMAEFAAVAMTVPRCDSSTMIDPNGVLRESRLYESSYHWPHIYYDKQNLMSRFQFCLDDLPGPVGGHMDMLRLHRFKTMNKCIHNFFARQNKKSENWGGLYGAATEMSRRLATLFDPFATNHVIKMRQSCPHLRAVKWATATSSPSQKDDIWLQHYPKGIRYHWGGRNLIEWRSHWRTRGISRQDRSQYKLEKWGRNSVRLHQCWECVASYQDSGVILNQLALPREREALQRLLPHAADGKRPVLIRRDREECIYRRARRGCGYTASDFCFMAWSCWRWAEMAGKDSFYSTYRDGLPGYLRGTPDTVFYGPNGELDYREWFLNFKGVRD
jgi:hypothetical protein